MSRSQIGASILVYDAAGQHIGLGIAPRVPLSRPLLTVEELRVIQIVGTCRSMTAYRIHVDCGPKSRGEIGLLNQLTDRERRRGTRTLVANDCK